MENRYTIILEFPDTDNGFELTEEFVGWVDENLWWENENLAGDEETTISVPSLTYRDAKKILEWVRNKPTVKFKLLQITEITERINELPTEPH